MNEKWRDIPGYEGLYQVSSLGRIRSLARVVIYKNRAARTHKIPTTIRKTPLVTGYPSIFLSHEGKKVFFYVHHLVAAAFIGARPDGMEVAHGDGDKENCAAKNLRYATPLDNDADKITHGTRPDGERNGNAKLTAMQVLEIRRRATERLCDLAREYGVGPNAISKVIKGERWRSLL